MSDDPRLEPLLDSVARCFGDRTCCSTDRSSPEEGRLLDEIRSQPDQLASAATASSPGDAPGDA